jgi:hypothetical protein
VAGDQRGAGSIGSLKRSRLPNGSITSITRVPRRHLDAGAHEAVALRGDLAVVRLEAARLHDHRRARARVAVVLAQVEHEPVARDF